MNMSLIRRTFVDDITEMNRLVNKLMGNFPSNGGTELATVDWTPSVDVLETPEGYTIKADLPQVKREDVKINVQNGVLTLTGERRLEKEEKGQKFHRIERSYGSFLRSFQLPDNIDESKITATFGEGVLQVMLPKTEQPQHNLRQIPLS
jgi:HSP20 family protein